VSARFCRNSRDLVDYALLLAFFLFASAALFIGTEGNSRGNWNVSSAELVVE
jgi:hypothetical protein